MSGAPYRPWGPSHQRETLYERPRLWPWLLGALLLLAGVAAAGSVPSAVVGLLRPFGVLPLLIAGGWAVWLLDQSGGVSQIEHLLERLRRSRPAPTSALDVDPVARTRQRMLRLGGGAYLGQRPGGTWVTADPEHAVLVLGPPRSGKTSCVVIPAVINAPGPVLCTATKPDVLDATWQARAQVGQTWLYDPAGATPNPPAGMRRLMWSPVSAAGSWDAALLTARAMAAAAGTGKGTSHEDHWRERATALLAPLLHAAHLSEQPIGTVLTWVLRQNLDTPGKTLEDHHAAIACDVLAGIARTEVRERSSIFSATAGTLAAYNTNAARQNAAETNFDPASFPASTDTIYITAPAHQQALCAPLVVGLLEQLRYATYKHASTPDAHQKPPVFFCLDEVANIAPIHDLPSLISEAGGQRLHILACLQDLSQAKTRWGESTADGLLTLFQTKLILNGIADPKTLEAISLILGEYDRTLATRTHGRTENHELLQPDTHSESISHHTQRHRVLTPGEIASLPHERGLLLQGVSWKLIWTTPWWHIAT